MTHPAAITAYGTMELARFFDLSIKQLKVTGKKDLNPWLDNFARYDFRCESIANPALEMYDVTLYVSPTELKVIFIDGEGANEFTGAFDMEGSVHQFSQFIAESYRSLIEALV